MFVEAVIVGMIIGFLTKGRLQNLKDLRIRGWIMILLAAIFQILPMFLLKFSVLQDYIQYFQVFSLGLLMISILININLSGMKIIIVGALSNTLAILFNNYKMPVSVEGLRVIGKSGLAESIINNEVINYINIELVTHWSRFLSKFIPFYKGYPFAKVLSIGDIIISIGIVVLIVRTVHRKGFFNMNSNTISYSYKNKY